MPLDIIIDFPIIIAVYIATNLPLNNLSNYIFIIYYP